MKDLILEEYKKGNIVVAQNGRIASTNLENFINQPVEGMLYDLNRLESVVLTFIDDPKWINDYAVCQVIRALKNKIKLLESEL